MSRKLDDRRHHHYRYTKKVHQSGGGETIYTTTDIPDKVKQYLVGDFEAFLKNYGNAKVSPKYTLTLEKLPDDKKGLMDGICNNPDNGCTSSRAISFSKQWNYTITSDNPITLPQGITVSKEVYELTITLSSETKLALEALKYYAKRNGFTIKNGKSSISSMTDEEFKKFEETEANKVHIASAKTLYIIPSIQDSILTELTKELGDDAVKKGKNTEEGDMAAPQRRDPIHEADIIVDKSGYDTLMNFAKEKNSFTIKDIKNKVIFQTSVLKYVQDINKDGSGSAPSIEDLIKKGLEVQPPSFEYDDIEFNKLYKDLVDDNPSMKVDIPGRMYGTNKVSMIIKPSQLVDKQQLYKILKTIHGSVEDPPDPNNKEMASTVLTIRRNMTASFFVTLKKYIDNKSGATSNASNPDKTPLTNFISKIYDKVHPDDKLTQAGRLIPIISTLRDWSIGKYTVSFDTKAAGEEALKQQIKDVEKGIENEFAIMSAFVGTKSQKIATKTALLAGMATGLWGLVSTIQQNPQTSAMLMAGVASAGPQALVAGAVIAVIAVSYFVYLKLQDKYAKYFNLIRTLNEYMIVLNKIDRLVRLSMRISARYQFDVNLKEIEAQLKVLFKRFDKMLSEDDVAKLEQETRDLTKIPDISGTAAEAEANSEAIANKALDTEKTNPAEQPADNSNQKGDQKGGGFGDFIFKVTFDVEMWNQKLNDDVVKLNIYFTTAMTEFSMVLNVIQMGFLTSGKPQDMTILQTSNESIKQSTEYRKMIIGILLNDILKLKVDFSYCNRGNKITNTKDESICLDPENIGIDAVGNRRSKFKEKLHGLIEHLVKVLNNKNSPYPPQIKERIVQAVIKPYVDMINAANPVFGLKNKFFLTEVATMAPEVIQQAKTDILQNVQSAVQKGGEGWRDSLSRFTNKVGNKVAGNTAPSTERDTKIIAEMETRAYDFVSDEDLTKFLIAVDKFVKAENEPSLKEKEEAKEVAVVISEAAQQTGAIAEAALAGTKTIKDTVTNMERDDALAKFKKARTEFFAAADAKENRETLSRLLEEYYNAYDSVKVKYEEAKLEIPVEKPKGFDAYVERILNAINKIQKENAAKEAVTIEAAAATESHPSAVNGSPESEEDLTNPPITVEFADNEQKSIKLKIGNDDEKTLSVGDCIEYNKETWKYDDKLEQTVKVLIPVTGKIKSFYWGDSGRGDGHKTFNGLGYYIIVDDKLTVDKGKIDIWNPEGKDEMRSIKKIENCPSQRADTGGRRLTRKKRRANKKKVRQTKAVKKYNKVAIKGKFFKKMI